MSKRTIRLGKGKQEFVFEYISGCEDEVMEQVVSSAKDPQSGLDWLDAAKLGLQVAHTAAIDGLDVICPEPTNSSRDFQD